MNRNFLNLAVIITILFGPILFYYTHNTKIEANATGIAASINCPKPTVIEFSSELCMECKQLEPTFNAVMKEYKNKVNFKKYLINSSDPAVKQMMKQYGITVVPTVVYINKNGKVVTKTVGSMPKAQLERNINRLINE